MFCDSCGAKFAERDRFCHACGARVEGIPSTRTAFARTSDRPRRTSTWAVGAGVFFVVIGAFALLLIFSSRSQTQLENKIQALIKAKDHDLALKLATQAVENTPDRPYPRFLKTMVLADCGKTSEAIREYERYLAINNHHSPDLLRRIGTGALNDQNKEGRKRAVWALGELSEAGEIPGLRD